MKITIIATLAVAMLLGGPVRGSEPEDADATAALAFARAKRNRETKVAPQAVIPAAPAAGTCTCNGKLPCECGENCRCVAATEVDEEEIWDRCSKGESMLVVIGDGPVPEHGFRLKGRLKVWRDGRQLDRGPGLFHCRGDGRGGTEVQEVTTTTTKTTTCTNGRCVTK